MLALTWMLQKKPVLSPARHGSPYKVCGLQSTSVQIKVHQCRSKLCAECYKNEYISRLS